MKFGIKCRVDSNTDIGKEPIQITIDGIDFNLVPTEEGLLSELTAVVGVDNDKDFTSQVTPSNEPEKAQWAVTVDFDRQIFDGLIEMVQYLEGALSFLIGVKKIYWDETETIFIPENEEESKKYNLTKFSVTRKYPEGRSRLTVGEFKAIVLNKNELEPFTIIKLFHRDGMLEFASIRYIQAFYNFYFVLEDLYAKGKTSTTEVEKRFKSSPVLRGIIQDVLDNHIKMQGNHLQNIQNFLTEENKDFSIDGIIELIVQVRGNLHHYSGKSTKRKGTPINQRDFESMAFLLMGISLFSIVHASFK
jgi:hypothetical protein